MGGRIEGTVPGLGRWDDEKTKKNEAEQVQTLF